MNWRKTLAVMAGIVVLFGIGLVIAINSIDVNRFKPDIVTAARNATGRELTMAGNMDLKIGLRPMLVVENVGLQNADWGSRPELATIQRLEIEVALLPLLKKEIEITRLVLIDPDILLETDKNGMSNLSFDQEAEKAAPPATAAAERDPASEATFPPQLTLHKIDIQNGKITYRDGRTGGSHTVSVETFASAPAPGGDLTKSVMILKGAYHNLPFELSGTVGWIKSLIDPNLEWPADLVLKVPGVTVAARGSLRDVLQAGGMDLTMNLEGDAEAIPGIGEMAGLDTPLPDLGEVRFSSRLQETAPGVYRLSDIDLNAQPAGAVITVKGIIGNLGALRDGSLSIHLAAPSLPRLGEMADVHDLPDVGPVTVDTDLERPDASTFRITALRATFLENDISGSGTVTLAGKRPKLKASLSSRKLDLRRFAPQASPDTPPDNPSPQDPQKTSGKDRVFSPDPLPLDKLKLVDADIQLQLAHVLMEKAAYTDLRADIQLDDGRLRMTPIRATAGGATLTAALEINAAKDIPTFSKKLQVKQLNLAKMFETLGIQDGVAGMGNVDANLTSRGRSVAEMMGNMNGRILFAMQDGFVKQRYLDLVSFDFTTGVVEQIFSLSGTPSEKKAEIQCLFGNLDIQNGIVDVSPIVMNTPDVAIFVAGDINFKTERLNLSVSSEPTSKTAVVKSSIGKLARIFKLTGTLAHPKLGIDPVETSMFLARTFGGTALAGKALAAETLLGSINAKENPCLQMMDASDKTPPDGDPQASQVDGEPKKSLKKVIEDTGKSILNIFKKP